MYKDKEKKAFLIGKTKRRRKTNIVQYRINLNCYKERRKGGNDSQCWARW